MMGGLELCLWEDVGGLDRCTERAGRCLPNLAQMVNATGGTSGNFARAVELDVRRQVVWKINGGTVG